MNKDDFEREFSVTAKMVEKLDEAVFGHADNGLLNRVTRLEVKVWIIIVLNISILAAVIKLLADAP